MTLPRLKPYSQVPYDSNISQQMYDFFNWACVSINQLIGQAAAPSGQGLQALAQNTIDPTTNTIKSMGSRMSSVSTSIAWTATTTTATFYWDGTNSSQALRIGRDDGTTIGPIVAGSPLAVSGLTANTTYYFYPYWDEALAQVVFATTSGVAVGSPPIAFTAQNFLAAQQQILRGRIPLGLLLLSTGVLTPNAGSSSGSGGSGGGGAGAGGGRGSLL